MLSTHQSHLLSSLQRTASKPSSRQWTDEDLKVQQKSHKNQSLVSFFGSAWLSSSVRIKTCHCITPGITSPHLTQSRKGTISTRDYCSIPNSIDCLINHLSIGFTMAFAHVTRRATQSFLKSSLKAPLIRASVPVTCRRLPIVTRQFHTVNRHLQSTFPSQLHV